MLRDLAPGTVLRYVPTYVNRDGMRTLMCGAQGRNTWASAAGAQGWLDAVLQENSDDQLESLWGTAPRFEVRPCVCWAGHFDPVGVWFDASVGSVTVKGK